MTNWERYTDIGGVLHRYTVDGIVYRDYRDIPSVNGRFGCARCGHCERHGIPNGCEDWRCDCDAWYPQWPLFELDPEDWRRAWERVNAARADLSAINLRRAEEEYARNAEERERAAAISVLPSVLVTSMRAMAKGAQLTRMLNIAAASRRGLIASSTSTIAINTETVKTGLIKPTLITSTKETLSQRISSLQAKTQSCKLLETSFRKCPTCERKAIYPNGWCGICKRR